MNNDSHQQPEGCKVSNDSVIETPSLIHAYCEILRDLRKAKAQCDNIADQQQREHLAKQVAAEIKANEQLLQQLMPRWPAG